METTSLTIAWTCAEPETTLLASAISKESPGQIGSVHIAAAIGPSVQARVVTGCVELEDGQFPGAGPGDLLICVSSGGGGGTDVVRRAVDVLRGEVGGDGSWLRLGVPAEDMPAGQGSPDSPKLIYVESREEMEIFASSSSQSKLRLFDDDKLPTIAVLAAENAQADVDGTKLTPAAQDALSLSKELIQLLGHPSIQAPPSLEGTEAIIPARPPPQIPELPTFQFPSYGDAVLLIIPTENKDKKAVLHDCIAARAPPGVKVCTVSVPVESDVNEQPYNDAAGAAGAYNRIRNALLRLRGDDDDKLATFLRDKAIGTVMAASIENYIQTDGLDRPADFGIAVVHNATTERTATACSRGVTVSPEFVARARRFGDDGDPDHGNVTVGRVLAAWVPGLDKADWHIRLAGCSRYDLLREAVAEVSIPW